MKKILILLILLIFPIMVNAEEVTKFSLNEITASPGSNVTVILNMDNKQEFSVLTAKIHYDNKRLEYVSSELKGLKSMLRGTDKNIDKGIVAMYAINLDSENTMKDNGNIMLVEFKIKEDVTEDIPITLEIKDFSKGESTKLKYEKQDGIITIKGNVQTVTNDKEENLQNDLNETIKKEKKKNDSVTWETTNDSIATVDEKGNVKFKDNGFVTVEAKDENGSVLYSKDYYVKEKVRKHIPLIVIIPISIILIITLLIIWRKKCQKRK